MKLSENQKIIASAVLTAFLVIVFQLFVAFGIPINVPQAPGQVLGATARNSIICNGGEANCVDARNGKDIVVYSDDGSTQKFLVEGSAGDVTIAGTLTATTVASGVGNGTVAAPSVYFTSDTDTGLYRVGANNIGVTAGGTKVLDCTASGCTNTGTLAATGALSANGGITVDTSAFTVADTSGNVATTGTLAVTGASTLTGAVTTAADLTVSADTTGGNAGAKNEVIGLPRIKFAHTAVGTNGTTETTSYTDDSSAGEYAPIDADVTEAEGSVDGIYRIGSSSYKALFAATAAAADGFKRTITTDNLEANSSIGCWFYPSVAIAASDLQILLTDDGGARNFNIGALTINKWNWVEVDITSLAAGTGDIVTEFGVTLTAQGEGALGAFNLYIDGCWKWAVADEEALGAAILQDGVLSGFSIVDAATAVHTTILLVEDTDYFVHYETGNDFIVWITDQSAKSNTFLIAY